MGNVNCIWYCLNESRFEFFPYLLIQGTKFNIQTPDLLSQFATEILVNKKQLLVDGRAHSSKKTKRCASRIQRGYMSWDRKVLILLYILRRCWSVTKILVLTFVLSLILLGGSICLINFELNRKVVDKIYIDRCNL